MIKSVLSFLVFGDLQQQLNKFRHLVAAEKLGHSLVGDENLLRLTNARTCIYAGFVRAFPQQPVSRLPVASTTFSYSCHAPRLMVEIVLTLEGSRLSPTYTRVQRENLDIVSELKESRLLTIYTRIQREILDIFLYKKNRDFY